MKTSPLSRRRFVKQGTAALAVAAAPSLWLPGEPHAAGTTASRPVRFGGPVFQPPKDPDELARAHRQLGYDAAYCPGVSLDDTDRIRALREAFAREHVVLAEVGRWVNLLDANPDQRRANLATVTDGLALAEEIGALCCVDIAGSFSPKEWYGPHPDNVSPRFFEAAVENARKIIDAVKPKRAKFCYEMMGWALPDSPDSYLELMKAIDRPAFGVHLDPCNLVNSPSRFYRHRELLHECFNKLGPQIVSCHAKDLTWDVEMNVHFREVQPGLGAIDYAPFLKRLAALPHQPPLMMEHLRTAEEYAAAATHIRQVAREHDVTLPAPVVGKAH
ncbi:MAG: sugar phosphate isomerase/epimerase [Verrucomicrobiales bacterium]|nr:sugar phosphate isomerase/epimerase [Verrucomicrobiales bacterium]